MNYKIDIFEKGAKGLKEIRFESVVHISSMNSLHPGELNQTHKMASKFILSKSSKDSSGS